MSFVSIFQMYHYLERTYQHVQTHKERLFDLHITEAMAKVFPKVNQVLPHMDFSMRKSVFWVCEQQSRRPVCTSVHSDN